MVIDVVSTVTNESSRTVLELDWEQSLFCAKINGEERKSSQRASMTHLPTPVLLAARGFTTRRMSRSQVGICTALQM